MSNADVGRRRVEYRNWTKDEDATLAELWQTCSLNRCSDLMGRGTGSIYNRVQKLGLKRTDKYKAITGCGMIKKGATPWNKGLKGYQPGGRSKETQFKAGQKPSNTWRPIGAERTSVEGHLYRKVADTGDKKTDWRQVHVLLWEAEHGPVPAGHFVVFRDRNPANIVLDNLLLVDRAEHMRRNTINRYPPEIHQAGVTLGWFRRKLKKLETDKNADPQ